MQELLWLITKHQISANQLVLLHCLAQLNSGSKDLPPAVNGELSLAIQKGLITRERQLTPKALIILSEAQGIFKPHPSKIQSDPIFIEKVNEYRNLFPNIKLPSGKSARGNIEDLKKRMASFVTKYPQYTWDLILDATELYIETYRKNEYKFMKTSGYYILKDHESDLAADCEFLLEGGDPDEFRSSHFTVL